MRERPEVFQKYDIRGEAPEQIDSELVFHLGKALGYYWESGDILVGRDIRKSSPAFYNAMISGLLSQGCNVTTTGLSTTDMTAYLAQDDFDGAVQITASHMPPEYGGFKPINPEGRILSNDEMAQIKRIYMREEASEESYGELEEKKDAVEEYREGLRKRYYEMFDGGLEGLKVVVDSSCSVGGLAAPDVFTELGAEVVNINKDFDSDFSAHSPTPSEASASMLQDRVVEEDADLGVIFDGDADRVMFVDENGRFVSGDEAFAVISGKYLERNEKVICSVNTGRVVEEAVKNEGGEIVYAPVGAVFTALKSLEKNVVFGGQPNGHLMDSEFVPYDSGSLFALVMAGIISEKGSLSNLVEDLADFEREKFDFETEEKNELMLEIREEAKDRGLLKEEKFNALKLDFGEFTVLLRPSGSEPVIRVTLEGLEVGESDVEDVRKFLESVV